MVPITHPKILSLEPIWAPFCGCSLIFHEFGAPSDTKNTQYLSGNDLHQLLYNDVVKHNIPYLRSVGFCPLPLNTYHLTFMDVINQSNIKKFVKNKYNCTDNDFVKMTIEEISTKKILPLVKKYGLGDQNQNGFNFILRGIKNWDNRVLVAELEICNDENLGEKELFAFRSVLDNLLEKSYGISPKAFNPHVSLGYFANKDVTISIDEIILSFNRSIRCTAPHRFRYTSPNLFFFEDMATYIKM